MKYLIDELNKKTYSELKSIFINLSLKLDQISFKHHFNNYYFSSYYVHQYLFYLPEHIRIIKFENSGFFGSYLIDMVMNIPSWINTIKLDFVLPSRNDNSQDYKLYPEFQKLFTSIPPHIHTLDLSAIRFPDEPDEIVKILSSVPPQIQELRVGQINFGRYEVNLRQRILSSIPLTVTHLKLESNEFLYKKTTSNLIRLFNGRYPSITHLSIANNSLAHRQKSLYFRSIMSSITVAFPNLQSLNLRSNQLGDLARVSMLGSCLQVIPSHINELDLGENNLLMQGELLFCLAIQELPLSIKSINLAENISTYNQFVVQKCISKLPPQIEILRLTKIPFMGLSGHQFGQLILCIPPQIHTLDISENNLGLKSVQEIICLLKNIPSNIQILILKNNYITNLSLSQFNSLMQSIPKTVKKIDFSDNAFETLPHSQMNAYLELIPDIEVVLDFSKIAISSYQGLVSESQQTSNLIRPRKLYHQNDKAQMLILLAQLGRSNNLPLQCVVNIGEYILGEQKKSSVHKKLMYISSQLNVCKKTDLLYQNLDVIARYRRKVAKMKGSSVLDYSMMGYFLGSKRHMINAIKNIQNGIIFVKLGFNRFHFNAQTINQVQEAFKFFPSSVEVVDLRGNGFEFMTANNLNLWLGKMPQHIKILFTEDIPSSLVNYLVRLNVPEYYTEITRGYLNLLDKAQILLNDYTQGDSIWLRIIMGYWNRHHVQNVDKIVLKIQQGIIQNIRDVFQELFKITFKNDTGALAKSLMFLVRELERAENPNVENEMLMMSRR